MSPSTTVHARDVEVDPPAGPGIDRAAAPGRPALPVAGLVVALLVVSAASVLLGSR